MPVTSSAAKALRVSRRRRSINLKTIRAYKVALKKARENPQAKLLSAAYSQLDRAAKKGVIHPNKAARLKSRLAQAKTVTRKKK